VNDSLDRTPGDNGQIVLDNILLLLQTPTLNITQSGNSVIVSWPNTEDYTLQQSSSLGATADWTTSGYSISTSNGMNSITITPPTSGNLFFRPGQSWNAWGKLIWCLKPDVLRQLDTL
jgi:hypothetical protein